MTEKAKGRKSEAPTELTELAESVFDSVHFVHSVQNPSLRPIKLNQAQTKPIKLFLEKKRLFIFLKAPANLKNSKITKRTQFLVQVAINQLLTEKKS